MKKINGKESNTGKGVNIEHNLVSLKMFCLIKKLLGIK